MIKIFVKIIVLAEFGKSRLSIWVKTNQGNY